MLLKIRSMRKGSTGTGKGLHGLWAKAAGLGAASSFLGKGNNQHIHSGKFGIFDSTIANSVKVTSSLISPPLLINHVPLEAGYRLIARDAYFTLIREIHSPGNASEGLTKARPAGTLTRNAPSEHYDFLGDLSLVNAFSGT